MRQTLLFLELAICTHKLRKVPGLTRGGIPVQGYRNNHTAADRCESRRPSNWNTYRYGCTRLSSKYSEDLINANAHHVTAFTSNFCNWTIDCSGSGPRESRSCKRIDSTTNSMWCESPFSFCSPLLPILRTILAQCTQSITNVTVINVP